MANDATLDRPALHGRAGAAAGEARRDDAPREERWGEESWRGPRAATVVILAEICESQRRARYQIPIAEALRARGLGRVVGAGQMFTDAAPVDGDDDAAPVSAPSDESEHDLSSLNEGAEDADDDGQPGLESHNLRHALHCVDLELTDVAAAAPVVLDVLRAAGGDAFDQGVYLEIHHGDGRTERLPVHKRQ